jgi:hypothetical protein
MAEQSTYPQFFRDPRTGTHVRYNSALVVCTASVSPTGAQVQVQHLDEPRLLHAAEALPSTEQEFLQLYERAYQVLVAAANQPITAATTFARRHRPADTWSYRQDGTQAQLRFNASQEDYGPLSVNIIYTNYGADARFAGLTHQPDARRIESTAGYFARAWRKAFTKLDQQANGGFVVILFELLAAVAEHLVQQACTVPVGLEAQLRELEQRLLPYFPSELRSERFTHEQIAQVLNKAFFSRPDVWRWLTEDAQMGGEWVEYWAREITWRFFKPEGGQPNG